MTQHLEGRGRPRNLPKENILDRPFKLPQPLPPRTFRATVPAMHPACSVCKAADETVGDTGWTIPLPERLCAGCRQGGQQ